MHFFVNDLFDSVYSHNGKTTCRSVICSDEAASAKNSGLHKTLNIIKQSEVYAFVLSYYLRLAATR